MTTTLFIELEEITCGGCSIRFAVPKEWIENKRKEGGGFRCPNGCERVYRESDADRLRKQLEIKERELREAKCEALRKQQMLEAEQRARLVSDRKLRRVHKGVCPCCKRTFQNLQRHIATKHPEVKKQ